MDPSELDRLRASLDELLAETDRLRAQAEADRLRASADAEELERLRATAAEWEAEAGRLAAAMEAGPREVEVVKQVIQEVPVEVVKEVAKEVVKEVVKEVPVERVVTQEVLNEVIEEVPVERVVVQEVQKVRPAAPPPSRPTPPAFEDTERKKGNVIAYNAAMTKRDEFYHEWTYDQASKSWQDEYGGNVYCEPAFNIGLNSSCLAPQPSYGIVP